MKMFIRLVALVAVILGGTAQATSFWPYAERTITDSSGRYYVVVKRKQEGEGSGPVTLTIAERGVGTLPVQSAWAKNTDGDSSLATVDPKIRVRDGDTVHGRIELDEPPSVILVSSTGKGVVTLDDYSFNNLGTNAGQNDFVFYSLKGECLHRKVRIGLFNSEQRQAFPAIDGHLSWLNSSWIDDQQGHVVLVGNAPKPEWQPIITVSLDSGKVSQGGPELIDQAINERNPGALSRALELGKAMKLRGSKVSLPGIVADENLPLGQRLRAAVLLAALGDQSGVTLVTKTVQRAAETDTGSLTDDEYAETHYAIQHCTEVLGEAALPLLKRTLQQNGPAYSFALHRAFQALGRKSLPALISVLEDDRNLDSQLEAAACLGFIGPEAEDAVSALITALHKTGAKKTGTIDCRLDTHAVWALGQIGEKAKAAVPDLEQLAKNSDEDVRNAAHGAIIRIQGKPQQR